MKVKRAARKLDEASKVVVLFCVFSPSFLSKIKEDKEENLSKINKQLLTHNNFLSFSWSKHFFN